MRFDFRNTNADYIRRNRRLGGTARIARGAIP
jgi:hypothetical protein